MSKLLLQLTFCVLAACQTCAQPPLQTANDFVPPFTGHFGFGTNLGYYPPNYFDEQLAILARGTPDGAISGAGITCLRPTLPDHFLDYWGYDIRVPAFKLYDSIGLKDNVVFVGYPAPRHRDSTRHCPEAMSEVFKNLYEPIWDDGSDGTPVNEENYYALYLYKTVSAYKNYVKFWEIWNEPDLDMKGNAWKSADMPGNWWTNTPQPCEMAIRAPIYSYVRMLRISYEVIKKIDPFAYVCIGGIGYPSFLDAVLRHSDNPNMGVVSTQFPLKGGAYFDCLSYHSYPHIEAAMREWSNQINNFRYFRHSDAGVDGVWNKKNDFDFVLKKFGYDGSKFPKKEWIITEVNLPRKQFYEFIGSDEAQVNFMLKTLATAPQHGIRQIHTYCLADDKPEKEATSEFSYMGFFENLVDKKFGEGKRHRLADAYKTASELLYQSDFDSARTHALRLPDNIRGAAFCDRANKFTYVLWAKTDTDRSEATRAQFVFPEDWGVKYLEQRYWHSSMTKTKHLVNAKKINLTGEPVFLHETEISENDYPKTPKVLPNPVSNGFAIYSFWMFEAGEATIEVFDAKGRLVQFLAEKQSFAAGANQFLLDWSAFAAGTYFIRLQTARDQSIIPVVKI